MADAKTREQLEAEWWQRWWAQDYSWAGLAGKPVGQNGGTVHGGLHGEQNLQEYWRRDPATGAVRDDAAMASELEECDGVVFHIAHLPPKTKSGAPTWKGDLKHQDWQALVALLGERLAAAVETKVDWKFDAEGPDARAQFAGCVLFGDLSHPYDEASLLHVDAKHSATLGLGHYQSRGFGNGARFRDAGFFGDVGFGLVGFGTVDFSATKFFGHVHIFNAGFGGRASFSRATFLGEIFFTEVVFSGDASFDRAQFMGDAVFSECAFEQGASFVRCRFQEMAEFVDGKFKGDIDFAAAVFETISSFENTSWPGDCRHWHSAFDQVTFRAPVSLAGAGFRALAAFDGATLERGVKIDEPETEVVANKQFRAERKAAIESAKPDGADFERDENRRRKMRNVWDRDQAKPVSKSEVRAHVRAQREERLRQLERGCRVLKQAMEYSSNKSREQMLYRFELQARRAQTQLRFGEKTFSDLYAVASDYGASIWRPFAALAVLIAVFAGVFWGFAAALDQFAGNELLVGSRDAQALAALDFSWGNVFKPLSALSEDAASVREGSMIDLLLTETGDGWPFVVRMLATVQSLLAIVLAFLFALAVRRRFQIS